MSFSQEGQDTFVIEYLNNMRNGYFIDIGAYDGKEFSNTYDLEKLYGWTGILVECDPNVVGELKKHRSSMIETRAIWSKSGEQIKFKSVNGGKLSGIQSTLIHKKALSRDGSFHMLETISLNDLLYKHDCPKHINYMSIDIEGAEYEVLSAFDFSYTFDIVSIEHLSNAKDIVNLMEDNGYITSKVVLQGNETIFVRKT
jgi:FkbM family methyltransferase